MKKISAVAGLLCFIAGQAPSMTFEGQADQGIHQFSKDAGKLRQDAAASPAWATVSPGGKALNKTLEGFLLGATDGVPFAFQIEFRPKAKVWVRARGQDFEIPAPGCPGDLKIDGNKLNVAFKCAGRMKDFSGALTIDFKDHDYDKEIPELVGFQLSPDREAELGAEFEKVFGAKSSNPEIDCDQVMSAEPGEHMSMSLRFARQKTAFLPAQ